MQRRTRKRDLAAVALPLVPADVQRSPTEGESIFEYFRKLNRRLTWNCALRSAGWTPKHQCDTGTLDLPERLTLHDAARVFLTAYGGLVVDVRGETTFEPAACGDDLEHILRFREIDGIDYYPVGRIDDECATCILVDQSGGLHLYIAPPGCDEGPWPITDFQALGRYAMG